MCIVMRKKLPFFVLFVAPIGSRVTLTVGKVYQVVAIVGIDGCSGSGSGVVSSTAAAVVVVVVCASLESLQQKVFDPRHSLVYTTTIPSLTPVKDFSFNIKISCCAQVFHRRMQTILEIT